MSSIIVSCEILCSHSDSPKSSPRNQSNRQRAATMPTHREIQGKENTPKHEIVVVADGQTVIKGTQCSIIQRCIVRFNLYGL